MVKPAPALALADANKNVAPLRILSSVRPAVWEKDFIFYDVLQFTVQPPNETNARRRKGEGDVPAEDLAAARAGKSSWPL